MKDKIEIDSYNDYIICHTEAEKIKISWHGRWTRNIYLLLARLRNPNCEVALLTKNGTYFAVVVYKVTKRIVYPDLEKEKMKEIRNAKKT